VVQRCGDDLRIQAIPMAALIRFGPHTAILPTPLLI
jgi:hypothetical protein